MPYVKFQYRPQVDTVIDPLAYALARTGGGLGLLNYTITRLLTQYIKELGGSMSYADIAVVLGTLEGVKQEFYRRVAAPYENKKMEENGDVY